MNLKRGFTLIELLVVVAIIGILSSVVLASLNSARIKGSDAAIKANLANMRGQAAIYYDGTGAGKYNSTGFPITCTYTPSTNVYAGCTDLFGDTTIQSGLKAAGSAAGAVVTGKISALGDLYTISVPLKTTTDGSFCVDSSGSAKKNSVDDGFTKCNN